MVVTIDVVRFRRWRDAFRLWRRPDSSFDGRPAFARALVPAHRWTRPDSRAVAIVATWSNGAPAELDLAALRVAERWRGVFEVQRTRGTLNGADPLQGRPAAPSTGPGAIWTCENAKVRKLRAFFVQNAMVVRELNASPGLTGAFGVLGLWKRGPWMCTLSFWEDFDAGLAFAYRNAPAHRDAIEMVRARAFGGTETYFARLGLTDSQGTIAGRDPFAGAKPVAA